MDIIEECNCSSEDIIKRRYRRSGKKHGLLNIFVIENFLGIFIYTNDFVVGHAIWSQFILLQHLTITEIISLRALVFNFCIRLLYFRDFSNKMFWGKVSVRRTATIAQLDEEGETVSLDETLRRFWEEQFLQYMQEVFFQFKYGNNHMLRNIPSNNYIFPLTAV